MPPADCKYSAVLLTAVPAFFVGMPSIVGHATAATVVGITGPCAAAAEASRLVMVFQR